MSSDAINIDPHLLDGCDQWAANGYPVFLGSELTQPDRADARFHVLPVPNESTVSYGGGTAAGPQAILAASWQLETWDGQSDPASLGIYTHAPVGAGQQGAALMTAVAEATGEIVNAGQIPVILGGEHSITAGVIDGLSRSDSAPFGVVQIDAHADLREAYEGNRYSHASVMRRIVEQQIPLMQLGVRALCQEEVRARAEFGVHYHDAHELVPAGISQIELPPDFPEHVYLTIDVDGLDPAVMPATGTPVPGGLGWYQTLGLVESISKQRRIIGFDVMEFAPIAGFHAYSFTAALLAYKVMGFLQRAEGKTSAITSA